MKKLKIFLFVIGLVGAGNLAAYEHNEYHEESNVPSEVMAAFEASFVYEDGFFRGAQIDMLEPYMNREQIEQLVMSHNNYPNPNEIIVFYGKKPKPRGCRDNNKWVCIVNASPEDVLY